MTRKTVLTGITTTGTPHIGNYLGAIKPAVELSKEEKYYNFYFLADFHALIKCHDPERVALSTREIAATWLAVGLDTSKTVFYRQTDIPEITELTWILTCVCGKGLMNRAHAYKAAVDANKESGKSDLDDGINMGLFSYPILMAADILMFNADLIPVGKDQIQHIEMARDIAGRFNNEFQPILTLPEAVVDEQTQLIPGLDGRKMSKSYDNTIPLFCSSDELNRLVKQIKTDTREPGEPKDAATSPLFQIYNCFANSSESEQMRNQFENGIAWGEAKKQVFEFLDAKLTPARNIYSELITEPEIIEKELKNGAERAREVAIPLLEEVRRAVGIRPLTVAITSKKAPVKKKQQTEDELARAEQGRQRAVLIQLKPLLEKIENAEDKFAAAQELIAKKLEEVSNLKKKAKQKAQNELDMLKEKLKDYL